MAAAIARSRSADVSFHALFPARPAASRCSAYRAAICARRRRSANLPDIVASVAAHLQHFEPQAIDRLERQRSLKALHRGGVQLPRNLEGAVAGHFGAVALKTQCPPGPARLVPGAGAAAPQLPAYIGATSRAQDLRAFAFELPAGEADPVGIPHIPDGFGWDNCGWRLIKLSRRG
jgi:hypothetical protein